MSDPTPATRVMFAPVGVDPGDPDVWTDLGAVTTDVSWALSEPDPCAAEDLVVALTANLRRSWTMDARHWHPEVWDLFMGAPARWDGAAAVSDLVDRWWHSTGHSVWQTIRASAVALSPSRPYEPWHDPRRWLRFPVIEDPTMASDTWRIVSYGYQHPEMDT